MEFNTALKVQRLGRCRVPSPMLIGDFVGDDKRVLFHSSFEEAEAFIKADRPLPAFEMAGPRKKIYFDPSKLKCGIVTCGGICPGLNDVIRSIVFSLHYHYGVPSAFGFRYGYEGLAPAYRHPPMELDLREVRDIHLKGGTILGSSRGPQDVSQMVDTLERMNIGVLFAIGGDGTLRGAQAISEEIGCRGLKISVIGIPKTIDNDISYLDKSFGFETAVAEARTSIYAAHVEAEGARNGIGLVKLMGRESGFIAAHATLANSDVNFCLVPEVPFTMEAFLSALAERLERRRHAVIVVAEGAGQDLLGKTGERDASGNARLTDIGIFLRDQINAHFKKAGVKIVLKYIDPSYTIRSRPANSHDSVFCLLLGHCAVHAGMTGRTNMVVGYWNGEFTHVPIPLAVSERKHVNPEGRLWSSVLESTGQPREMV
ncbi:MAG: diphosphate--fructose-6-phosphate 1-phosphotransferase [Desulfococcus sp. 4484_242]|nr:MAG: diphosphate--fructose-6-phosphate 1-phosphotransferase [Desulfococcus sp. 4484_242]